MQCVEIFEESMRESFYKKDSLITLNNTRTMHIILNCRQSNLDIVTLNDSQKIQEFKKIFDSKTSENEWLAELSNFFKNTTKHYKTTKISIILPELSTTNINLKITKNDISKFSEFQIIHRQLSKKFHINTEQFIYKFQKICETTESINYIVCLINKKLIKALNKIFYKFHVSLVPPTISHAFFAKSFLPDETKPNESLFVFIDDNITRIFLLNKNILGIRQFNSIEVKKIEQNNTTQDIDELSKEINITTRYFINNITAKVEIHNVFICSNIPNANIAPAILSLGKNIIINNIALNSETQLTTNNCNKAAILGTINILNDTNDNQNIIFPLTSKTHKLSYKIISLSIISTILLMYVIYICKNNQLLRSEINKIQEITTARTTLSKTIENNTVFLKNLKKLQETKSLIPSKLIEIKHCLNNIYEHLYIDILSITQETSNVGRLVNPKFPASSEDCTNGSVMLKIRGRIISASSSVQTLNEHLNVCFRNLLTNTVNCMKVELKSKKNSSSRKNFVFSLMSDPESYM